MYKKFAHILTVIGVVAVMVFGSAALYADVPQLLNVQGVLYDNDGNPVNGTYSLTFSFYKDQTGGSPLTSPYTTQVTVNDGIFHSTIPINGQLFTMPDKPLWLGIRVDTDPEMTPRQQIVTVAYAFQAQHADEASVSKDLDCSKPGGCVEDDELQDTALEIAVELTNGAQSAIRWTKYALNNWLRAAGPIYDTSTALEILGFAGEEAREGLASHMEKRPPEFPRDSPV